MGAKGFSTFYEVILPATVPFIIAGMRTSIAIAFICLVAAEMAGASGGLGFRIEVSHLVFRVDRMIAAIVVLGLLGAVTDRFFALAVDRLLPWYRQGRDHA